LRKFLFNNFYVSKHSFLKNCKKLFLFVLHGKITCFNRFFPRHLNDFTLNTARHSLNERFLMWTNVSASKWLVRVSLIHAFFALVIFSFINMGVHAYRLIFNTAYVEYITFYLNLFCVETLLHPVICIKWEFLVIFSRKFIVNKISSILTKSHENCIICPSIKWLILWIKSEHETVYKRTLEHSIYCLWNYFWLQQIKQNFQKCDIYTFYSRFIINNFYLLNI